MEILLPRNLDRFKPIGRGYSSQCLTDGIRVLKLSPAGHTETQAQNKLKQMQAEYSLIRSYLDNYVQESGFFLTQNTSEWLVGIDQEIVAGTPLRASLREYNSAVEEFLGKCLNMYENTRQVPDLIPDIMPDPSLSVYFSGKFTFLSGPNVLLIDNTPRLVDTTYNRTLRHPLTAPILRSLVARRIRELLKH